MPVSTLKVRSRHRGSSRDRGFGRRKTPSDLAAKLLQIQEQERSRIARELHDGISQQFAVLVVELGRLAECRDLTADVLREQLRQLRAQSEEVARDVRTLSHRLYPAALQHLGLVPALRGYCARFAEREGIEAAFNADAGHSSLGKDLSLSLYRIVQECLHNVSKHAHASRAEVRLQCYENSLQLRISDNGQGFARHKMGSVSGIGLASIEERAKLAGGNVQVQSTLGRGTTICVNVPIPNRESGLRGGPLS